MNVLTSDKGNSAFEIEQGIADYSLVWWVTHDDGIPRKCTTR